MAKAEIKINCKCCGKIFTHTKRYFSGRTAADKHEEWAKENITTCPECYKKTKKDQEKKYSRKNFLKHIMKRAWQIYRTLEGGDRTAKLTVALKKAWAEAKNVDKLAELEGTEKQVAWAENVREKAIEILKKSIKIEKMAEVMGFINSQTIAKFWIENRYNLATARQIVELCK